MILMKPNLLNPNTTSWPALLHRCCVALGFLSKRVEDEVGRVQASLERGRVVVTFPSKGTSTYRSCDLALAKDESLIPLKPGAVFGEIALLCNTRHLATFRAGEGEVTIYAVSRSDFKECFSRSADKQQLERWGHLLAEVRVLCSLLESERPFWSSKAFRR